MRELTSLAVLAATVMLAAALQAQVRIGAGIARAPISRPILGNFGNARRGVSVTLGSFQRPFHHRFFPQLFFFGEPWFPDYFESPPPTPPQIIVLQQPAAAVAEPDEEPRLITPLLIELQGDRYVRSGGSDQSTNRTSRVLTPARSGTAVPGDSAIKASAQELAPAVLVFRDAHREEIDSYAIVAGAIYINSNYWSSGAWTRKIQLADLDLPSTLKLNRERGVKFVLPAGPNEVVTRP